MERFLNALAVAKAVGQMAFLYCGVLLGAALTIFVSIALSPYYVPAIASWRIFIASRMPRRT